MADLNEVAALARELMDKYDLDLWEQEWDRATKRAGICKLGEHVISLSRPLMSQWTMPQCRDTILHEIAHALTPGHNHDRVWRRMAIAIGASGSIHWGHLGEAHLPSRYVGECPNGHTHTRERMTKREASCADCSPRFDKRYIITWRKRGSND